MEFIKFSILVPAFKSYYLKECIESVLAQSYQNFELIIVNDASPENLDAIVEEFDDERIRYYKNDTGCGAEHVVDNWNICLSYSTGQYVICMGDDDRLREGCLQAYADLINKYPKLYVYHMQSYIINEDGNICDIQEGRSEYESVYSFVYHIMKSSRMQFIGDFLFETKQLKEVGGFYYLPYAWHSDRISVIRAAMDKGIANSSHFGFEYRVSSHRISSANSSAEQKLLVWNDIDRWYENFFLKEPTSFEDKVYFKISKRHYSSFITRQVSREAKEAFASRPALFFELVNGNKKCLLQKKTMIKLFVKTMLTR